MSMFFNKELNSLEDLLGLELDDLYDAEQRLCVASARNGGSGDSEMLKMAFEEHARETQRHVSRLEQVFVLHPPDVAQRYLRRDERPNQRRQGYY